MLRTVSLGLSDPPIAKTGLTPVGKRFLKITGFEFDEGLCKNGTAQGRCKAAEPRVNPPRSWTALNGFSEVSLRKSPRFSL
jgi:hypothetical protein